MNNFVFTSESVCAGHPDKICDQISDAIVDAVLENDKHAHLGIEALVTTDRIVLAGEVSSTKQNSNVNYEEIARGVIKTLGYTNPLFKFTYKSPIDVYIHEQSQEIALGVGSDGAGDQGMMFGYACKDTPELMPIPITLAHRLAEKIDHIRTSKTLPYLRPDGKTQVSILYENNKPVGITSVVVAVPHDEDKTLEKVTNDLFETVVHPVLGNYGFTINKDQLVVNGTGVWHIGGPTSDSGVTGRKIVVDGYGGFARVGGGAFSGKDPTKVDRSGAYAARFLAKNIVAQGLADKAEVRLAYVIGRKIPLMKDIETFGTEHSSIAKIREFVESLMDTSVKGIILALNLQQPIYFKTASYGHFGREEFPWEKIV